MEDVTGWGLGMRNIYVGAALAVVFAGALFAASRFWPHRSETLPPPATPDQVARAIKPGFVGSRRIGAWDFVCLKLKKPPGIDRLAALAARKSSTTAATQNGPVVIQNGAPDPAMKRAWEYPHCRVGLRLHNGRDPSQWADIAFTLNRRSRDLGLLIRLSPDAGGQDDPVDVQADGSTVRLRILFCGPISCVVVPFFPGDNVNTLPAKAWHVVTAKRAVLMYPGGGKAIPFNIPLAGLQPAIAAMRRTDLALVR